MKLKTITRLMVLNLVLISFAQGATDTNPYGIGNVGISTQNEYERFQGAFYLSLHPLKLSNTILKSDNQNYTSTFDSNNVGGFQVGVRHPMGTVHRFALLGDYGVSVNSASGAFASNDFKVSSSSSRSNLLSIGLNPSLLLGYFLTDQFHPYLGLVTNLLYSRLQGQLSGGDNEYFEFHYGPTLGLQIVNFPVQQLFLSVAWTQFINTSGANRLYNDDGLAQVGAGLSF